MKEAVFGIDIASGAWAVVELTAPRAEARVQLAAKYVVFDSTALATDLGVAVE